LAESMSIKSPESSQPLHSLKKFRKSFQEL
jgi:hypothetical protein